MRLLMLTLLLASICLTGLAKDRHLPLPPQVMNAKTVYIDNQSGLAVLGDRAYQEINEWGRLQVVQDRNQADLIFLLSSHEQISGARHTGNVGPTGNISATSRTTVSAASGLIALNAKTGDSLWTDSKGAAPFRKPAIKRAIDELRRRIEEQEFPGTHGKHLTH